MNLYECIIITRQNFLQNNRPDDLLSKLSSLLGSDGEIVNHEYWGLRNFSYIIKRKRRGHYVLVHLKTSTDGIGELRRRMFLDDNILRFMLFRIDELPKHKSPLAVDYEAEGAADSGNRGSSAA